jgi:hypothetical protein
VFASGVIIAANVKKGKRNGTGRKLRKTEQLTGRLAAIAVKRPAHDDEEKDEQTKHRGSRYFDVSRSQGKSKASYSVTDKVLEQDLTR